MITNSNDLGLGRVVDDQPVEFAIARYLYASGNVKDQAGNRRDATQLIDFEVVP